MAGSPNRRQSRSAWRPERRGSKGRSRSAALYGLSAVLTVLVAFVIWLMIPVAARPVEFVVVGPVPMQFSETRLAATPTAMWQNSVRHVGRIAESLNESFEDAVLSPTEAKLGELTAGGALKDRERALVVYLATDFFVASTKKGPELFLGSRRDDNESVRFAELVTACLSKSTGPVIVAVDPIAAEGGMANGDLGDFATSKGRERFIEETIRELDLSLTDTSRLAILVACDVNEVSLPAGDDGFEVESDERPTAFAVAVAESVATGRARTVEDFIAAVRDSVAQNGKMQGREQTVGVVGRGGVVELLQASISLSQSADPEDSDTQDDEASDTDGAVADTQPDAESESETPEAKLAVLVEKWNALRADGAVRVLRPKRCLAIDDGLLALSQAIRFNDTALFRQIYDDVNQQIRMMDAVVTEPGDLYLWASGSVQPSAEQVQLFSGWLSNVRAGNDPVLPPGFDRDPDLARTVSAWFVSELADFAAGSQAMEAENLASEIEFRRVLLSKLPPIWWASKATTSMLIARELLGSPETAAISTSQLDAIARFLKYREQFTAYSDGADATGHRIHAESWSASQTLREQFGEKLLAAERWLALDDGIGVNVAIETFIKPKSDSPESLAIRANSYRDEMERRQKLAEIRTFQQVDLPWVVQFYARRAEQAPHNQDLLNEAAEIANQVASGSAIAKLPEALFKDNLLANALLGLTQSENETDGAAGDPLSNYATLEAEWKAILRSPSDDDIVLLRQLPVVQLTSFDIAKNSLDRLNSPSLQQSQAESNGDGIWLSFFSIRMLDVAGVEADELQKLWTQWAAVVAAKKAASDPDDRDVLNTRSVLAKSLHQAWSKTIASESGESSDANESPFVTPLQLASAIDRDLREHIRVMPKNRSAVYQNRRRTLVADFRELGATSPRALAGDSFSPSSEQDELSEDGSFSVQISAKPDWRVYVLNDDVSIGGPSASEAKKRSNWWQLKNQTDEVTVKVPDANTGGRAALLATDERGIPIALRTVSCGQNTNTQWEVQLAIGGRAPIATLYGDLVVDDASRLSKIDADHRVGLPFLITPQTEAPLPLELQIRLKSGQARRAAVQVWNIESSRPVWPKPVLVAIADRDSWIRVPVPADSPKTDIEAGFCVTVTPLFTGDETEIADITDEDLSKSSLFAMRTGFLVVDEFVTPPVPEFNAERGQLSVALKRPPNVSDAIAAQLPQALPVQLEMPWTLRNALSGSKSISSANILATGTDVSADFDAALLADVDDRRKEFGVSLFGYPQEWWWKLPLDGGKATPLTFDKPTLRAVLQPRSKVPGAPVPEFPIIGETLVVGPDWSGVSLDVEFALLGSGFQRYSQPSLVQVGRKNEPRWTIQLDAEDQNSSRVQTFEVGRFHNRRQHDVTLTAGEEGVWLLESKSSPHTIDDLLSERRKLPQGHYKLIATLKDNKPSGTSQAGPVAQYELPLVVDNTPPTISDNTITVNDGKPSVTIPHNEVGPLKIPIQFTVVDLESTIQSVSAGTSPEAWQQLSIQPDLRKVVVTGMVEVDLAAMSRPLLGQSQASSVVSILMKASNGLDLESKVVEKKIRVVALAAPTPKSTMKPKPLEPGSIKVTGTSGSEYEITVEGKTVKKQSGKFPIIIEGLPPGKYKVTGKAGRFEKGPNEVTVKPGKVAETSF